ncbi:MAG TPA: beta-galactosidase trimerization domain-containing protein [bacterium]|nr:beta-galactosidase trimerization domain-containing protein [bacterium]HOL34804.1 beta-galactosidase trimerization domain-containing protein [bacterium]HPP08253.1 beta-galactosidase trimerization domain-containing protein [bacterium]
MKILSTFALMIASFTSLILAQDEESIYVRFKMIEPKDANYYVKIGGYIHIPNWYIPSAYVPGNAHQNSQFWVKAGTFTPWFDLKRHAGKSLHGRLNRSGGIAEFPNITADFITDKPYPERKVIIELATLPDETKVVKKFEESYKGSLTSFLVSNDIKKDAESLETASQMTERHLTWANQATGGKRYSPQTLIIQTSFWAPQREELNLKEAKVLWLLGFNTVGNQTKEVKENYKFRSPGHMWANFGPEVSKDDTETQVKKIAEQYRKQNIVIEPGSPFNFSDEVTCPQIKNNPVAIENFHAYLKQQKVRPEDIGVKKIEEAVPIETPDALKEQQKKNSSAANRLFYYTSRFRQISTNERFRWLTEAVHKYISNDVYTSTLVADHPYFAGTGLGMGMGPNPAWGSTPLACDWFDMARRKAVDMAGIEDWMGLQYMYGPNWTWEGFQLMGFQASIFRSGSNSTMPIMAWITPSDEINLRLKTASALCQGAKHFFYWTYGPTATSTENYWSDLRGEYDGIAKITKQLARAEHILADGRTRPTNVALLYSISSDLWQPYGYVHMLERRLTYLALTHQQYLVDMLTEQDIIAGKLKNYSVLYVTDPCIHQQAIEEIKRWVKNGGYIRGSCGAGTRNQFNEKIPGLAEVFGIRPHPDVLVQQGRWHIRGALNEINYLDTITPGSNTSYECKIGAIGAKINFRVSTGKVIATFDDGSPAGVRNQYGKGIAEYIGSCPAIAYGKEAKFIANALKEKWQDNIRKWVLGEIIKNGKKLVDISHPVVEAGVYDSQNGTCLVLANFTYQPIEKLNAVIEVTKKPSKVISCESGILKFNAKPSGKGYKVDFSMPLDINDIVMIEF